MERDAELDQLCNGARNIRHKGIRIADNGQYNNETAILGAQLHQLPGVYLRAKMRRQYPNGMDLGHVLGYMNEVSAKDLEKWSGIH